MTDPGDTRARRAWREFGRIPGVVGIGSSLKWVRGDRSRTPALCIIVRQKLPWWEIPRGQRLPRQYEGVPIDVRESLVTLSIANAAPAPLVGGAHVEGSSSEEGTLGCFAMAGSDRVLLGAGHTLTDERGVIAKGGDVGSPSVKCCCCCKTGVVAEILRGRIDDQIDAVIAKLNGERPAQQRIPGLGADRNGNNVDMIFGPSPLRQDPETQEMFPVSLNDHVRKVGSSTNLTGGEIDFLGVDVPPDPEANVPAMVNHIVVRPRQSESFKGRPAQNRDSGHDHHFCIHGDSGAVVIDDDNKVAGLLIRKGLFRDEAGKPPRPAWEGNGGVFTDIHRIMSLLNITIPASEAAQRTQQTRGVVPGSAIFRMPSLSAPEAHQRAVLESLKWELSSFPLGRALVLFAERYVDDIMQLVNHERRVTVVWHRARGPNFLALLLRGIDSLDQAIPQRVEGQSAQDGLEAMRRIIAETGAPELGAEVDRLWPYVQDVLPRSPTLRTLLNNLREVEFHG